MRSKYWGLFVTGLLAYSSVAMVAVAAERAPARPIAQADTGAPDGSIVLSQIKSDKAKSKYADDSVQEMRDGLANLQKRIEEARKVKDIVLLNCLNEKFSSVNALLKVTETANILMAEALSQNNSQNADHQFRKVVIARFKAKQFLQEANECSGDITATEQTGGEDVKVVVESALEGTNTLPEPIGTSTDPSDPLPISPGN